MFAPSNLIEALEHDHVRRRVSVYLDNAERNASLWMRAVSLCLFATFALQSCSHLPLVGAAAYALRATLRSAKTCFTSPTQCEISVEYPDEPMTSHAFTSGGAVVIAPSWSVTSRDHRTTRLPCFRQTCWPSRYISPRRFYPRAPAALALRAPNNVRPPLISE